VSSRQRRLSLAAILVSNRGLRVHRSALESRSEVGAARGANSWWPSLPMMLALAAGGLLYDTWASQKEHVWRWLQERWCTRVELRSAQHRELCDAFLFWCSKRSEAFGSQNLIVEPPPGSDSHSDDISNSHVALALGFGRHMFTVSVPDPTLPPRRVILTREVDESTKHKQGHRGGGSAVDEVITLIASGADAREFLVCMLEEARVEYQAALKGRAKVYCNDGGYWELLCWRQYRKAETMQLTAMQRNVLKEVRQFFAAQASYAAVGIPWRRGYLLQGPPGTGKSSFISVAAGVAQAPMYILSLRDPQLNDASLLRAVNSVPSGGFLILEDVDSVAASAANMDGTPCAGSTLSLSGLLNAIDGIAASEGRILMMTANRPEVLPQALLRLGRIDHIVTFDPLRDEDARAMTQRLLLSQLGPVSDDVVAAASMPQESEPMQTAAELQHRLLQHLVYR
jgi:hypothetical protein